MTWFLSLIPQYARLQAQVSEQERTIESLKAQAATAEARCADLKQMVDAAWRNSTGRSVFGVMTDLTPPDHVAPPRPVSGARRLGREVQMEHEKKAATDLRNFFMGLAEDGQQ